MAASGGNDELAEGHVARTMATLRACPTFAALPEQHMVFLARLARRWLYAKHDAILREDEARDEIILVERGCIRAYRSSAAGAEATIEWLWPGETYGLFSLECGIEHRDAIAAEEEGTVVLRLPLDALRRFLHEHPELLFSVIGTLAREYRALTRTVEELTLYTVRQRLARELIREVGATGSHSVKPTHRELAIRIYTQQLEVTRALQYFQQRGWTSSTRYRPGIMIVNLEDLVRYAEM